MSKKVPEPSISRNLVIKGAGLFWIVGGLFLLFRSYSLIQYTEESLLLLSLIAITISILKSRFMFSKIVKKNITRIEALVPGKKKICLFAFQSVESYILIIFMVTLGNFLRNSDLSADLLFVIYLAIGLTLIISSRKYLTWHNS